MSSRLSSAVACVALASAGAAHAEWVKVGTSGSGAVWSMDAARIRTVGGHRQAWVQIDYSQDRSVAYRRSINLFSLDCSARTSRLLSYVTYDSYGKLINSETQPDYGSGVGYDPVVPDSMGEAVLTVACAGEGSS